MRPLLVITSVSGNIPYFSAFIIPVPINNRYNKLAFCSNALEQ
jgi:hypothetical protein